MLVTLLTCTTVVLLACGVLAAYEVVDFRRATLRDMSILADVLGKNTRAALAFEDRAAARDTLLALQAEPHVVAACLYAPDGSRFADYLRSGAADAFPPR